MQIKATTYIPLFTNYKEGRLERINRQIMFTYNELKDFYKRSFQRSMLIQAIADSVGVNATVVEKVLRQEGVK